MQNSQEQEDELELELPPIQQAMLFSQRACTNILLMDEAILLLAQKRRTLEEKAIANHFHSLIEAYSRVIALLHMYMSKNSDLDERMLVTIHKLRTVNEKVRNRVEELLKIIKYDLNFLEQYFEYEYCGKLLDEDTFLRDVNEALTELEGTV